MIDLTQYLSHDELPFPSQFLALKPSSTNAPPLRRGTLELVLCGEPFRFLFSTIHVKN
jgi:hypothetical protein